MCSNSAARCSAEFVPVASISAASALSSSLPRRSSSAMSVSGISGGCSQSDACIGHCATVAAKSANHAGDPQCFIGWNLADNLLGLGVNDLDDRPPRFLVHSKLDLSLRKLNDSRLLTGIC